MEFRPVSRGEGRAECGRPRKITLECAQSGMDEDGKEQGREMGQGPHRAQVRLQVQERLGRCLPSGPCHLRAVPTVSRS